MNANVHWNQKMSFTGEADTGYQIPLEAAPESGGDNQGLRPMELIAIGLAGCTAMDVISILKKKRQEVTDFEVILNAERAETHPKVFTHIHLEFVVKGNHIDPAAVDRAIQLSEENYCPAQAMLRESVKIDHRVTIIQTYPTEG